MKGVAVSGTPARSVEGVEGRVVKGKGGGEKGGEGGGTRAFSPYISGRKEGKGKNRKELPGGEGRKGGGKEVENGGLTPSLRSWTPAQSQGRAGGEKERKRRRKKKGQGRPSLFSLLSVHYPKKEVVKGNARGRGGILREKKIKGE